MICPFLIGVEISSSDNGFTYVFSVLLVSISHSLSIIRFIHMKDYVFLITDPFIII